MTNEHHIEDICSTDSCIRYFITLSTTNTISDIRDTKAIYADFSRASIVLHEGDSDNPPCAELYIIDEESKMFEKRISSRPFRPSQEELHRFMDARNHPKEPSAALNFNKN